MNNVAKQIIAGVMIYFTAVAQVFGQAALLPNAEQQFFDSNGHPLASGTVTFYVPGTSQKKTTWQNAAQTINNQNPVSLDVGGKAILYGQGSYRQVVQDVNGNIIWDQPTTAYGASQPSGATGTDTAPVGSVMAYSGFVVPTNWQLATGQALSRTTFAALMQAITISATNISCTNTSTTLTGFTDTSLIRIGAPIEATCLPTSTTVASITNATTIVVSNAAAATSTVTATIFPWGNGDQVSTFNVPDLRGRAPVGADCMNYVAQGSTCAGNLTATYYGANPGAGGQTGGTQSKTLTLAQLPTGITVNGSVSVSGSVSGTVTVFPGGNNGLFVGTTTSAGLSSFFTVAGSGGNTVNNGSGWTYNNSFSGSNTLSGSMSGSNTLTSNNTSGTAHSVVNPDATVNYIIKVAANSTGAGGVVSFGGMFGDIVCNSTLTCAPIANVNTVGCTPATTSQLGCVEPDGVTIKVVGGQLTAIAGVASSISIGGTGITGGTNGEILSVSAGALNQLTTSGSGSVALTTSPTFITPTLGVATATTINGNSFSGGPYTLTGTSGKTLAFNNTLTLAGIDSTTLTFQGTDTYVGRATTDTLTNKTLNCANNTCSVRLGSDVTGNLPLSNLVTGSLDQVIGYFGSTLGNAVSINNCANALTYSTSTHTFGCNSSAGTGTVTSITSGSGLVTSTTANCSQSAITASGTFSKAECVNAQTGTSYAIQDSDRAKLITASNAAAQAYTIAQAGAANNFFGGWYTDVQNNSATGGVGIVTITASTSQFNVGGTLSSTLKIFPGQSVRIISDGTNYQVVFLTPNNDGAAKAWVNFTGSGTNGAQTINSSYNVSGVSRTSTGTYTVTFTTAFASSSSYVCSNTSNNTTTNAVGYFATVAAGSIQAQYVTSVPALSDPTNGAYIMCFGR